MGAQKVDGGWRINSTKAYVTNDYQSDPAVIAEHPIHRLPMDALASSLGEGTQDVQKLVIFRELMKP
jgi:alkylation response protein AidB-like acyl-CoA dehydrogenase